MANTRFNVGDKVKAYYPGHDIWEEGMVSKVVPIPGSTPDYYVSFPNGEFDMFDQSELLAI